MSFPVLPQLHGTHRPVLYVQCGDPALDDGHRQAAQFKKQGVNDVGGLVGDGEHPVAPLHLQFHAQLCKEALHLRRRRLIHGAVKEFSISGCCSQHFLRRTVVGDVAPPLPRNVQLPSQLGVALHQADVRAQAGGGDGRHHTRGSAPHHNKFMADLTHSCTFS